MSGTIYELIENTLNLSGQGSLLQGCEGQVLFVLVLLSAACCFAGFKLFRPIASAIVLCGIIIFSFLVLAPAWGMVKCVTFCAVVGVALAGIVYLSPKSAAAVVCTLIAVSWVWPVFSLWQMPVWLVWGIVLLTVAAAGALAMVFPLWSICAFTAIWGGLGAVLDGWRLWSEAPLSGVAPVLIAVLVSCAGCCLQLVLFRRQKLFKRIMPQKLAYQLEKRKQKEAAK